MSDQLHASAALPPGKEPQYPLDRRLGGPGAGLDDMEKKIFLTIPGLKLHPLNHPARSQSLYRIGYHGSSRRIGGRPLALQGECCRRSGNLSWKTRVSYFGTVLKQIGFTRTGSTDHGGKQGLQSHEYEGIRPRRSIWIGTNATQRNRNVSVSSVVILDECGWVQMNQVVMFLCDLCSGGSWLESLSWLKIFVVFRSPFMQMPALYLKLGYGCFLTDPPISSFTNHSTIWCYTAWDTDSVIK
jgi:hypothetical protein